MPGRLLNRIIAFGADTLFSGQGAGDDPQGVPRSDSTRQ
jgi:hypothetical protein